MYLLQKILLQEEGKSWTNSIIFVLNAESHDGRIFAIGVNSRSTDLITCIDDIYFMLDKYPENPSSADTELPEIYQA
jgi:hypothetical protein